MGTTKEIYKSDRLRVTEIVTMDGTHKYCIQNRNWDAHGWKARGWDAPVWDTPVIISREDADALWLIAKKELIR